MRRTVIPLVILLMLLAACGRLRSNPDVLPRAVNAYNTFLRWKKYDSATAFRTPEDRADFAARYLAAEEDLSVDSIEVRSINVLEVAEGEPPTAEVVVVAHAYLLPSTVLEKIIMKQRWEQREGNWLLIESDRELVPPLDEPSTPPKDRASPSPSPESSPSDAGDLSVSPSEGG